MARLCQSGSDRIGDEVHTRIPPLGSVPALHEPKDIAHDRAALDVEIGDVLAESLVEGAEVYDFEVGVGPAVDLRFRSVALFLSGAEPDPSPRTAPCSKRSNGSM